jgi:hypothetical protein
VLRQATAICIYKVQNEYDFLGVAYPMCFAKQLLSAFTKYKMSMIFLAEHIRCASPSNCYTARDLYASSLMPAPSSLSDQNVILSAKSEHIKRDKILGASRGYCALPPEETRILYRGHHSVYSPNARFALPVRIFS